MADTKQPLFLLGVDTEQSVLAIRAQAMAQLQAGKTVMEWQSTDTRASYQFGVSVDRVIRDANIFLRRYFPAKYGRKITRVSFDYRRC